MLYQNSTFVCGNLGGDLKLCEYTTPDSDGVATKTHFTQFSVAYTEKPNGKPERTHWYYGTVWGPLAVNVAASCAKGDRVMVYGTLEYNVWTDKETGAERSGHRIRVEAMGPELRFATADVTRTPKSGGQNGGPAVDGNGTVTVVDPKSVS